MNPNPTYFNSWSNMNNQFPPHYSYLNTQWNPNTYPIMKNSTPWIPWEPHSNPHGPWSPG